MKPPIVIGAGAAMAAGGAVLAKKYYAGAHRACTLPSKSAAANPNPEFLSHCLRPGAAYIAGLALLVAGGIILLFGLTIFVRSISARARRPVSRRRSRVRGTLSDQPGVDDLTPLQPLPPVPPHSALPRQAPLPGAQTPTPLPPLPPMGAVTPMAAASPAQGGAPPGTEPPAGTVHGGRVLQPPSAPAPQPAPPLPPAGWYQVPPDGSWRWWDGTQWAPVAPAAPVNGHRPI